MEVDYHEVIQKISPPQYKLYLKLKEIYGDDAQLEYEIPGTNRRADVAIVSKNLDVEYDGWRYHRNHKKDSKRDEEIMGQGWDVVRFNKTMFNNYDVVNFLDAIIDPTVDNLDQFDFKPIHNY